MKVTLKEIAEMAGVHRATVDKVLHGRPGVSDEVRQRIKEIIREVGYVPNPVGRALQKQGNHFRIAAVLADVDALPYLRAGIDAHIAERAGFDIEADYYITKFHNIAGQVEIIEKLIAERVDGIILSPIHSEPVRRAIDRAADAGIPVVTTNSDIPGAKRMAYVGQDAERAARVAARLMGQFIGGSGKVAIITSSIAEENNNYYVRIREQAFIAFMQKQYRDIHIIERIESMEDPEVTYRKTKQLLLQEPKLDGIYITCGGVAQVGRALKETGRGKQIKVICYEDYPEILELMREDIVNCTLGSDVENQGRFPARMLLDYLIYNTVPEKRELFTEIKILVKECIV